MKIFVVSSFEQCMRNHWCSKLKISFNQITQTAKKKFQEPANLNLPRLVSVDGFSFLEY